MFRKTRSILKLNFRRLSSFRKLDGFDWKKQEEIILEPFNYMHKVTVPYFYVIPSHFNHWLQVPTEKIEIIQEILHIFSTWGLIIDDVQDDSPYRYKVPTTHRVFGLNLTINALCHGLLQGTHKVTELNHPQAPNITFRLITEFIMAQGTHVYWREQNICPTEEAFTDVSMKKDGSYFAFPVELMQLFSSNKNNYIEFARNLGLYYSLLDDYYNLFQPEGMARLAGEEEGSGKLHICSDITECKFTIPIIHAMQFPDVACELEDILNQRTNDPKLKIRFVTLLKKHGSDEYTRDKLVKMEDGLRTEIEQFGGNPMLTTYMDDLSVRKE